jgi:hypothetical protein
MGFHMADRTGYEGLTPLTYKIGYLFQSQVSYFKDFKIRIFLFRMISWTVLAMGWLLERTAPIWPKGNALG